MGTPTPDGVGDNTWGQIAIPCAAGTYTEGGYFSTLTGITLPVDGGFTAE